MKKIAAILIALVFSSSAFALDISQLKIGVSANHGIYGGDGKELNYDSGGTLERTTKKSAAFVDSYGSVFLELAVSDVVSVGVDYVPMAISTPANINSGEGGAGENVDISVEADFNDLMTIYLLAKSDMGIYGKLGFSSMEIDVSSKNAGTYADPGTTDGMTIGLGYEHDAGNSLSIRAELAYHEFDDVAADNGITDKNELTVTGMQGATGRISVVKSF
ncbi:outer membrane beta-barrel protein [Pelagibacterales bacterium SAG-MED13]|nr:outer membrane beta-barrel protein [Pelagibacterales bacterium SAG-MED13]